MTTRSRLSSGIRTLLGDPADSSLESGGVPEHLIYEVLTSIEGQMLIDLNLSDQNRRVQAKPVSLNANLYDFSVNSASLSLPAFAQIRYSQTDLWQDPVEIVNLGSIDQAGIDGRLAVAFYGTPLRARLSWIPEGGQTLTLWFDRTIDLDGDLTAEPAIEDAYTIHMKMQAVALIQEMRGETVGTALAAMIGRGEQQWRKSVRMSGQMGLVRKPSSHPRAGIRRGGQFQRPGGGWL